jgi:hypothetical protein
VGQEERVGYSCSSYFPDGADSDVGRKGAYSIVMSGAYKDDRDEGDEFDYTGMGLGKNDQEYKSGALQYKHSLTPI